MEAGAVSTISRREVVFPLKGEGNILQKNIGNFKWENLRSLKIMVAIRYENW